MKLIRFIDGIMPRTGLLKWRDLSRYVDHLRRRTVIDYHGANVVAVAGGVRVLPGRVSADVPEPLSVYSDGSKTLVKPGIVFAGATWQSPVIGIVSLFRSPPPVIYGLPEQIWLKLTVSAFIADAQHYIGVGEIDQWRWDGVRLISAEIEGRSIATPPSDVPGVIHETVVGADASATVVSDAEIWLQLATRSDLMDPEGYPVPSDATYTNLRTGNVILSSDLPVSVGGGDYEFTPLIGTI